VAARYPGPADCTTLVYQSAAVTPSRLGLDLYPVGRCRPRASPRSVAERTSSFTRHYAALIAAFALAGVNGTERSRTPAASNTALEIADGMTAAGGSPAPHGGAFG